MMILTHSAATPTRLAAYLLVVGCLALIGQSSGSIASAELAIPNTPIPDTGLLEKLAVMPVDRAVAAMSSLEPEQRIDMSLALATIWNQKHEPEIMRAYINYAFDLAHTNGFKRQEGAVWFYRAQVALNGYDLESSLVLVDKAIQAFTEQNALPLLKQSLSFKANALDVYGRLKEAMTIYEQHADIGVTSSLFTVNTTTLHNGLHLRILLRSLFAFREL